MNPWIKYCLYVLLAAMATDFFDGFIRGLFNTDDSFIRPLAMMFGILIGVWLERKGMTK